MSNALLLVLLSFSMTVGAEEQNLIEGSDANDFIEGSASIDVIYGGLGDDVIDGEAGADILIGGQGADVFVVNLTDLSFDTVMDFDVVEGDSVLFELTEPRAKFHIPKDLGTQNVRVDRKGNVKILLTNGKTRKVINLNKPNLHFYVKDRGDKVGLVFKKDF